MLYVLLGIWRKARSRKKGAQAAAAPEVVRNLIKLGELGEQRRPIKRPKESIVYRINDEVFFMKTALIGGRLVGEFATCFTLYV